MVEILTKTELKLRLEEISEKITQGCIFICPTDTVYGISCNALKKEAVEKVRSIKTGRPSAPFSVIVPSLDWVKKNCAVSIKAKSWLQKLPGPYTLVLPLKNKLALANNVAPDVDTIGIRYPDHWFTELVSKIGIPLITTSANRTGEPFMTSLENIDPLVENNVELIIYEGPKDGKPSKIIYADKGEVRER